MLVGVRKVRGPYEEAVRSMLPEEEVVRATVSAKPFSPAMVRVELADEPASRVRVEGLAVMIKSTTLTVTVTERVKVPLVAVTVTV